MIDSTEIRKSFPHLASHVYLNTASAGLSFASEGEAAAKFYEDKRKGIGGHPDWVGKAEATRHLLGKLLGVSAARVHFCGSTTEALNLIALALPLGGGDVVVADDEFPSVMQPWAKLKRVPISNEAERTQALCAAIDGNSRVLAVSHVHWRTGTRVDLDQLRAACAKYDCRLIVDGVQAAGAVPVDASVADAYCASVFKWLLSGFGLGFMVLSDRLSAELQPTIRGYWNAPPSQSLRYGHLNYPGIYVLNASLNFMGNLGWDNIHARVMRLAAHTLSALKQRGFEVVTPDNAHAGIVSIRHAATAELVESLAASGVQVEDGAPYLRVSPHFYNSEEDIDSFLNALVQLNERRRYG